MQGYCRGGGGGFNIPWEWYGKKHENEKVPTGTVDEVEVYRNGDIIEIVMIIYSRKVWKPLFFSLSILYKSV